MRSIAQELDESLRKLNPEAAQRVVMRYLLDTNVWIHYLKSAAPVEDRSRKTPARDIAVCSVVWVELLHGARKYERREERVNPTAA